MLLVEPEATSRRIVAEILRAHGLDCDAYATLAAAGDRPLHQTYDCLVADAPIVGAIDPRRPDRVAGSPAPEVGVHRDAAGAASAS